MCVRVGQGRLHSSWAYTLALAQLRSSLASKALGDEWSEVTEVTEVKWTVYIHFHDLLTVSVIKCGALGGKHVLILTSF